jgi:hypothetical protein
MIRRKRCVPREDVLVMLMAVAWFIMGSLVSLLLYTVAIRAVPQIWATATIVSSGRIEKACDSVTSFVAFLIPAGLAITTWVYEKVGTAWFGPLLALSTAWFLLVLCYTMYIRFNFIWRLPLRVTVGAKQNLHIARWLTTVMVGLTAGLVFLAVPTFVIAFRIAPEQQKEKEHAREQQVHYEYHSTDILPCVDSSVTQKGKGGGHHDGHNTVTKPILPCSVPENQQPKKAQPE